METRKPVSLIIRMFIRPIGIMKFMEMGINDQPGPEEYRDHGQ